MTDTDITAWPVDVVLDRPNRQLSIRFDDGADFTLDAEFLRVHSPSAEVQGHTPDQRQTVGGKKSVGIVGIEEVGNYAIRIIFDDQHNSGLFTWKTLYRLGRDHDSLWQGYLIELAEKGLTRG